MANYLDTENNKFFPEEFNNILSVVAAFNSSIEKAGDHGVALGLNVMNEKKTKVYSQVFSVQLNHKPADVTIDGVQYEDTSFKDYLLNSLTWVNMGIDGDELQALVSEVIDTKIKDYKEASDSVYADLLNVADFETLKTNISSFKSFNKDQLTDRQHYELNSLIVEIDKKLEPEEERY